MTSAILTASIVIQFFTAALALRLIGKTRRLRAWVLIAAALLLMAFRRSITLVHHWTEAARPLDPVAEIVALAISLLLLVGVALIGGVFDHLNGLRERAERELDLRRRAEEQARAGEARLQAVFEAAEGVPIQGYDRERRVVYWNRASEQLYGWTANEAMGRRLEDLIVPPGRRADMIRLLDECFRTGRPVPNGEFELVDRAGKPLQVFSSQSILPGDGAPSVLFSIDVDLTDLKRAEEERLRMQKLESLGIVAGGIAHDFNNLLTGVFGNIDLALMDLPAGHPALRPLQSALGSLDSARRLTGRLLTFAQGGNPVLETLDIRERIRETVQFNLTGANVAARFDLPADLWPVRADGGQFDQVVANLTINARQAMAEGGELRIEARNRTEAPETAGRRGPCVELVFRDTGSGIPPEHLPRIFDPYFTTKKGGTGLGLAVTHSIVAKHGGFIRVHSRPGEGAVFEIYLPAETCARAPDKAAAPAASAGGGARILVMDDEAAIRATLTRLLERSGYRVVAASDGREALEQYAAGLRNGGRFDLVILDLTVPGGMGGKETIRELRALDPLARAIVSSGYSSDPVLGDYAHFGFDGAIAKPFDIGELRRAVAGTLAQR